VPNSEGGDGLTVSAAIELLREELEEAWEAGAGRAVQFGVDDITLTLSMVATRKKGLGGKIRWWVVEAGGDASSERAATQTMVLTLKPALVDDKGNRWSMQVAGKQQSPGK
jgi:Trypsin-co-occurring domain 2